MSMMIHRHFEDGHGENLTTLADVTPGAATEDDFDIHAPLFGDETAEAPRRRGRPRKIDTENAE